MLSFLNSSKVLTRDIDGSLGRRGLSTDETIAHILSLLSEMYSTTTAAIQFILYELAMNPECQEAVLNEFNTLFTKVNTITDIFVSYFNIFYHISSMLHVLAMTFVH